MAVSRPFYDLGGWLGPPQQVSAKKIFRATQPPFSRGRKQAKNRPFWTGHLMTPPPPPPILQQLKLLDHFYDLFETWHGGRGGWGGCSEGVEILKLFI